MIKVISFDIGGTLLYTQNINEYNLKKLTALVKKPYEEVRYAYKTVFQKQDGTFNVLVNNFTNLLQIETNQDILNFFEEKFKEENNITKIENDIELIFKTLKDKGYKIILFSNSCCLLKNNLDDNLLKYVDEIFYSYKMGYTKSDKESFKIVEDKMNVSGEEILHIGDTLKSDYLNPIKYGWNALFYGDTEENNIKKIKKLEDVVNIL